MNKSSFLRQGMQGAARAGGTRGRRRVGRARRRAPQRVQLLKAESRENGWVEIDIKIQSYQDQ